MSKNYINNKDLLEEVKNFKKTGLISEELGKMLLELARNYSSKGSFAGYTWREDMISEAVYTCAKYLKNFDPEKSTNAFAYITQICKNAFKAYIKKQKDHSKIKDICFKTVSEYNKEYDNSYTPQSMNYEQLLNYHTEDVNDEEYNRY